MSFRCAFCPLACIKRTGRWFGEQAGLALLPRAAAGASGAAQGAENAREAVDALLEERLGRRGFAAALEVEAGRAADAAADSESAAAT